MKHVVKTITNCLIVSFTVVSSLDADEREDFFEARIRPLLISRCTECHGSLTREGKLQLDHQAAAFAGGESGKAIIPGDAKNSLLYQAVAQTHATLAMPPDDSLSNEEIASIRQWIDNGAIWPVSKTEFFQRSIFNTLNKSCIKCHDEKKRPGGLSLASRQRLLQGGDRGPAAIPGDAEASLLIRILKGSQSSLTDHTGMLSRQDLASFVQWINDGMNWREPNASPTYVITETQRKFWAFQPVTLISPPKNTSHSDNPVDHYIQSDLDRQKLSSAPQATPRDLIRRAYYDLLGLPPTPAQILKFETNFELSGRAAFAELIDELLKSPHYGERWGRHLSLIHI